MKSAPRIAAVVSLVALGVCILATQSRAFQWYGSGPSVPVTPAQGNVKAEFYWSRLRYDSAAVSFGGFGYGYGRRYGRGNWSRDYPKADRQLLLAIRRLTRIDARPTEQVVDLDNNAVFNYPFLYAVAVSNWTFTGPQAARLRQYLLRGGFLMVDDFHGTEDWQRFVRGMRMVLPNRPIVDLDNDAPIFHTLYGLNYRFQVPGEQYVYTGRTYEKDGYVPKWRAIRADDGSVMVAICHNMHLGDAWEWADSPEYPERFSSLAFRVGIDYALYAMTH
ncbi:MAG TPA: DUF4159 domain-containing protein [Patescibacteria group bacterium]|nr:DUF4159 domain-containing protein [Patescibacteria group bacterium]